MSHTKSKKLHQEQLLHAVNSATAVLLAQAGGKDFEASLLAGMEIIGRCVDVDRIHIWRNEMLDGIFYYVSQFHWQSGVTQWKKSAAARRPYAENPEWEKRFLRDECINGPTSSLTRQEQAILEPQGVKSILAIPLYLQGQFYGFFSFDDCRQERAFTEDEVKILRSAGLMMVSAINRNAQAALLHTVNRAASVLLATENEETFETSLLKGMELLGHCVGVDRIHIWRNEAIDGALYYVRHYAWVNSTGRQGKLIRTKIRHPYNTSPGWESKLSRGECINGPFSSLTRHERNLMKRHDIKSLLIIPVHLQEHFWGFISFGDCHQERAFTEDEVNILRSASLMMISAVNRYEQAFQIRKAHERARLLLDATPLVAQLWDRDGHIFYCNEEAFKVFKLKSKQEYIDRFYDLSPEYQPDGRLSSEVIAINNTRALKKGKCVFEWMHQLPDGTPMPAEITLVRVMYGDSYTIAGYVRDLREHKQIQAELEAALKEAQKANRAKSSFLAKMSHEMRTPLNAIIGLSELALESREMKEESYSDLEKICNAGTTLLSTVNDILDISKIEAGKFELALAEYDVPSLINDTVTQCIMHRGEKPIRFILDIDENLPVRLYGDELRNRQIFNNLLSNAFKYTKEGTVELGVNCAREGDAVWMTARVKDSGIGIRPEDLDRLFLEYAQIDKESNRKIEGTGLGLPITKRILELMGGSITVESEYGKGCVFTVRFPQRLVTDAVIGQEVANGLKSLRFSDQRRRQSSRLVRIRLPYARVLVVDDVQTNLDVVKGMLKPYGMHVDYATSGRQAIEAIRAENVRYNAVFMDYMMPEMDGMEAVRIIREEIGTEYARTIPIIALTANAIIGSEEMFLSKGFQAFLSKPIEIARLDAVVRQWIRDKSLEASLTEQCIPIEGQMVPNLRKGEDRRVTSSRRSGVDRRTFGKKIAGLDMNKGIKHFGGDEASYLQVLRSYAANTPPLLERVRGIHKDNLADYAIVTHGIKGSSRSIYAEIVGAKAEALEKAAKEGNYDFVMANNTAFIESVEKLVSDLKAMFRRTNSASPKPQRKRPDKDVLDRLLAACESYDMDTVDAAMTELESYEYESDDGFMVWLRENVDRMNFTQIKERLLAFK